MIRILTIVGARPQFIKAAALSRAIEEGFRDRVEEVILHTGQHYDAGMSDVFFSEMHIPLPKYNLGIGSYSHGKQTGMMIQEIEKVLMEDKPDGLVVYGDTNSTLAGAIAASKMHVPIIHIEAGLRSFNKKMPEEINRIACDHMSTLLFSPTETGIRNLAAEGIHPGPHKTYTSDNQGIFHCGDLMYDNTLYFKEAALKGSSILEELDLEGKPFILATVHRPSNTDVTGHLQNILDAFDQVSRDRNIQVVLPLHPRTAGIIEKMKKKGAIQMDHISPLLRFTSAVSFLDMIQLESHASVILTDSGGVQKEAYFLEKPVVVLREETEWVEIIESGKGKLTGPHTEKIVSAINHYLDAPPKNFPPHFGNGNAAKEILEILSSAAWC